MEQAEAWRPAEDGAAGAPSPGRSPGRRAPTTEEAPESVGTIVVKIGGSTLGSHDTTLQDLVALQREGLRPVVVHGGGKVISRWMERQGIRPRFVDGLRVTDEASLEVVVAVLSGLINKTLVASLLALGGRAVGICGADGGVLQGKVKDRRLGLVGSIVRVDVTPIKALLEAGYIPVVAPVAVHHPGGGKRTAGLLNVNADTAAGEIAAALEAERLVFLTDVEGVLDPSRRLIPRLTERQARSLMRSRIVAGGMLPKLEACLTALRGVRYAQIVDGRRPGALREVVAGHALGTRVG